MIDLGDVYRAGVEVRDPSGTLANATTVTITITRPDGTVLGPLVVQPTAPGLYGYDHLTELPGRHTVRWVASGQNAATYSEYFEVANPDTTFAARSPYVSIADLEERFRPLDDVETVRAQALLGDAWAELQARVPGIIVRLRDATLDPMLVVRVVTAMVARVLRNPDGKRQESRTIDDFTHSWTIDQAVSTGELYATPEEIGVLSPASARLKIGTLRLGSAL